MTANPVHEMVSVNQDLNQEVSKDITQTPVFNQLYTQIRGWVRHEGDVSAVTIIAFVTRVMTVVQRAVTERGMGSYKKQLVIALMNKLIGEIPMSDADRSAILPILDTVVGGAMDVIVSVATGKIDLGKMLKNCNSCCSVS